MISEADALAQAMRLHPEMERWKDSDYERAERKQGVNWRIHLQMDAVVLRRASDGSLPDHGVLEALQKKGQSELDAIHAIAKLVAEDLWKRLKMSGPVASEGPKAQAEIEKMNDDLNQKISRLALL